MSRLRPFRSRVGVAGAAGLAALSLLVTSLTPLALRASAAEESTQATDVVSSQDGATASSDSEAAAAPAAEAGVEAPAADTDTAGADAADADAGSEAPAAEVAPEDQPRTRRARSTSAKPATLAMTVTNDSSTLAIRDKQITTINYACSSVTTPCEGASIEVLLPAPVTPAGTALTDKLYTAVAVTGSTVLRTEQTTVAGNPRMKRLLFPPAAVDSCRHFRSHPDHLDLRRQRCAEQLDDDPTGELHGSQCRLSRGLADHQVDRGHRYRHREERSDKPE